MKILSLFAAIIFTGLTGIAQSTCATSFKVNNGNGTCGAAGELRLTFPGGCPPMVPVIDSIYISGAKHGVTFAQPNAANCGGTSGYISYCVTSGNMPPANVWTIFFRDAAGSYSCTVVSTNVSVLAVKFLSFDAALIGNSVACKWSVADQADNSHYELERSFDGTNFSSIAYIFGQDGSSSQNQQYSFLDKSASMQAKQTVFYRVKEVDNLGRISYSNVLSVKLGSANTQTVHASPNPFTETMSLSFESGAAGKVEVKLVNLTGQPVLSKVAIVNKGNNTFKLANLGALPTGIYVAQVSINGVFAGNQKVTKN